MLELVMKMNLDITAHVDWDTLETTAKVRIVYMKCALINNQPTKQRKKQTNNRANKQTDKQKMTNKQTNKTKQTQPTAESDINPYKTELLY